MSETSSERLMHLQFLSYVQEVAKNQHDCRNQRFREIFAMEKDKKCGKYNAESLWINQPINPCNSSWLRAR